jgi:phage terminase large subunit-like protein
MSDRPDNAASVNNLLTDLLAGVSAIQAGTSGELGIPVDAVNGLPLPLAPSLNEVFTYPDGYQPLVVEGIALPRCASERVRAMSATERGEWDHFRYQCRTDPIFLANNLMGMSLQENPHRAFFNLLPQINPSVPLAFLSETVKKYMILWPRSVGKTSCIRVWMCAILLAYPQARIGFVASSKPLGKLQNASLKEYFENPSGAMQRYFPEYCLHSVYNKKTSQWEDRPQDLGTTEYFSLPCYTAKTVEHSFTVISADSKFSGLHFDVEVLDDLVNNDNFRNAGALENCFQTYLQASPLLVARGTQVICGTRYDGEDTYGRIIASATELAKGNIKMWKFSIENCYSRGPCQNCGHYEIFHDKEKNPVEAPCTHSTCHCQKFTGDGGRYVLFPEVIKADGEPFGHTLEYLDNERAFWGDKFFYLQYMNQPLNTADKIFTQPLINGCTIFAQTDLPPRNLLETFICGDLAYSEGDRSDRDESVLYVFQATAGRIWVWHCKAGRWSEHDRLNNILELIAKVRPKAIFFEKTLNWQTLNARLLENAPKYNLAYLPIFWTDVSNARGAKAMRIEQIEVAMKNDRVRLFAGMEGFDALVRQLLSFPTSRHDDYMDALSQCLAAPTGIMVQPLPTTRTAMDDIRRWMGMDQEKVEDSYPDNGGGNGICM